MERLTTGKGYSYWARNGAYSDLLEAKWNELVPQKDSCETVHGELIRSFARLNHDYFNNGNGNVIEHETTSCPECSGYGYEEVTCLHCNEKDEEEGCEECEGSGVLYNDCSYCDGECNVYVRTIINPFFEKFINFLKEFMIEKSHIEELTNYIIKNDDSDGTHIYNSIGDAIGYQILTTENKPNIYHKITSDEQQG